MGFRLGDIQEKKSAGELKGIQREIACDCWFTSQGRTMPRIIKVMDNAGFIYTIKDIEILYSEEKTYSGIPTIEHFCKIRFNGMERYVKLIYTKENCKWALVAV